MALVLCLVVVDAAATKPGDSLHVVAKEANLLEAPSAGARVLKLLPLNAEVLWLGTAGDKFHRVSIGGLTGFVQQSDLSPTAPDVPRNAALRLEAIEAINETITPAAIEAHAKAAKLQ